VILIPAGNIKYLWCVAVFGPSISVSSALEQEVYHSRDAGLIREAKLFEFNVRTASIFRVYFFWAKILILPIVLGDKSQQLLNKRIQNNKVCENMHFAADAWGDTINNALSQT
jgi:hypothetical protein